MANRLSEQKSRAVHSKMKDNPYKNAAMAMSKAVADDGILGRISELRNAKAGAGEAPPEPSGPQQHSDKPVGLQHTLDGSGDKEMGSKSRLTEEYDDKGGQNAMDHHKQSTGAALHEVTKIGGAQEGAEVQEDRAESDGEDNPTSSHADRISRYFNPPNKRKRTVNVGSPSKSDFGSLHARSMNKSRPKE